MGLIFYSRHACFATARGATHACTHKQSVHRPQTHRLHEAGLGAIHPAEPAFERRRHAPEGQEAVGNGGELGARGASAEGRCPGPAWLGRGTQRYEPTQQENPPSCPAHALARRPARSPQRSSHLQRSSSAEMTAAPRPNSVPLASSSASASLAKVRAASTGPKIWGGIGRRRGGRTQPNKRSQPHHHMTPCECGTREVGASGPTHLLPPDAHVRLNPGEDCGEEGNTGGGSARVGRGAAHCRVLRDEERDSAARGGTP